MIALRAATPDDITAVLAFWTEATAEPSTTDDVGGVAGLLERSPGSLVLAVDGDTMRFELQPDGAGTVLTLTDTFDEYGKAARDGAGWHACLDMLGHTLDGTRPAGDNGSNWREVYAGYIERLGPEASTIGPPEGHG